MKISNCRIADVNDILSLYQSARALQAEMKMVVWPHFDVEFLQKEIEENRQWKITNGEIMVCNWTVAFEDKEIWGERDRDDSIYIHRICTNPNLRGNRGIDKIVNWSREYAKKNGRRFVRLDTLGNNTRLIEHYTSAGFNFLGMVKLIHTDTLPAHYRNEPNCCLFELDVCQHEG